MAGEFSGLLAGFGWKPVGLGTRVWATARGISGFAGWGNPTTLAAASGLEASSLERWNLRMRPVHTRQFLHVGGAGGQMLHWLYWLYWFFLPHLCLQVTSDALKSRRSQDSVRA